MTTRTRRLAHSLAAGLLAGAFGLTVPAAASADDDDHHRSKRYSKRYDDHRHHKHRKHHYRRQQAYYAPHYGWSGYGPSYAVHSHGPSCGHGGSYSAVHDEAFYCGPCGHHFGSLNELHGHVHHHHHVPVWRLPYVVIQASVGWVFGG